MYTVTVRYSEHGLIAMNLKAESIQLAREKALHFKSQAFHVEIKNSEDLGFPLHPEDQAGT